MSRKGRGGRGVNMLRIFTFYIYRSDEGEGGKLEGSWREGREGGEGG